MKHSIFIAGAGGIGRAAGLLLREFSEYTVDLWLGDRSTAALNSAHSFMTSHSKRPGDVHTVTMSSDGEDPGLETALKKCEVLLDCLPGRLAPKMARLARANGMHYANLTEYVQETNEIMEIARDADTGFILQTGLAPGFIGVLAMDLFNAFCADFGVKKVDRVGMKVGALTRNAAAPHFYGFTWSPIGVATEYVKQAVVIRKGSKVSLPSLSERETIILDGKAYEADLTSGGAADLPDALLGRVKRLDYKTLRYPGHYKWVQKMVDKIPPEADLPAMLEKIMLTSIPSVEDDTVVLYADVQGPDSKGRLRLREAFYQINTMVAGGQTLRAIQSTTAAPLAECARMLLSGAYKGLILQSQLDSKAFLKGPFVKRVYGSGHRG